MYYKVQLKNNMGDIYYGDVHSSVSINHIKNYCFSDLSDTEVICEEITKEDYSEANKKNTEGSNIRIFGIFPWRGGKIDFKKQAVFFNNKEDYETCPSCLT